jgi:hypothetical protein
MRQTHQRHRVIERNGTFEFVRIVGAADDDDPARLETLLHQTHQRRRHFEDDLGRLVLLLDIENEWHKLHDVAEALLAENAR